MLNTIKRIVSIRPYVLTLKFNTGKTMVVDLEPMIRSHSTTPDSKYAQLLDHDYFRSVQLNPESIYCDNGLDFCPDVMYAMGHPIVEPL